MADENVVNFPSRWTFANIASAVALVASIGGGIAGYVTLQNNTEQLRKEVSIQWEKIKPVTALVERADVFAAELEECREEIGKVSDRQWQIMESVSSNRAAVAGVSGAMSCRQ